MIQATYYEIRLFIHISITNSLSLSLARSLRGGSDDQAALQLYVRALASDARHVEAWYNRGVSHQHLGEIGESLSKLQPISDIEVNFIPWRGDFTRGIFVSSLVTCEWKAEEIHALFEQFYEGHPFTHVSKDPIFLKQVVNTNKCVIQPEKVGTKLVVHSVTDNLLKGASGQAVQNMNLMFDIDETTGLQLKANIF